MSASVKNRIYECFKRALPVAMKTSVWFLKIMLPVSFGVMLLSYFNILPYLSSFTAPLFTQIGLPGDAALVLITSIFTNIYTVIALLATLDFTVRESIILAMMCLISHNFIVETLVLKKNGSSAIAMILLRISMSFVSALLLNWLLPSMDTRLSFEPAQSLGLMETLTTWAIGSLKLAVKIVLIISVLMVFQRLLEEFGVLKYLSLTFGPLMTIFGLPRSVAFLWLVGNTLGLAYGAAIMMDYVGNGKLSKKDADLLNYHLAISHSQLEDPLLFAVLGLPLLWLIIPRILLAIIVVWLRKAILHLHTLIRNRHVLTELNISKIE